ncbi:alpha-mannosidase [Terrimicrobium sacchariphilum]|uniref:Alpha-mannosidase n=1 Tax=Terrimicrobium sacchariphilum TaxID=690879 RepID=A0A146G2X7_TERSA|nr:alpha-mannosidase [Terrimicrobium sacchariphilum]GAT31833.1 alpha-mannosidase [Terrimicrobium sacchariphilum]
MLPKTFLSQLVPARVGEAVRRVEKQIWRDLPGECRIEQTEPSLTFRTVKEVGSGDFHPVPEGSFHWGPKYAQSWFRVTLPEISADETIYFNWQDQAEATAYIDGVPYSGLDIAHQRIPLPAGTRELWIESVCIRSGVWLAGEAAHLDQAGSLFVAPKLESRNDAAWAVYHDLKVMLELMETEFFEYQPTAPGLTKPLTSPVRYSAPAFRASRLLRRLFERLDRAVDVLDHEGLDAMVEEMRRVYAEFPGSVDAGKVVLTGHAHIDLVWLWPERVGEFKAVHSWSTQTRLLETYPEFRFGYSQPASYEAVGRRSPELLDRVKGLIQARKWDAVGAAYVEGDTQMPCGEAILRCLRIGQEEFRALKGSPSEVFWLPDVFGYSGAMPQLLKGLGVKSFFTTKLSWSSINRFPHTSFVWQGLDDSSITAHVVLIHDYNEWVDVKRLREDMLHHQQSAVHPEVLIPTGYGDGGGGPTETMIERARRVANLAGMPQVEWGNIEPFFERQREFQDELPVVKGELLLELHRGVFTTHGELKYQFRRLERALQTLEAAHVVRGLGPIDLHYWKRASFSHFHDYIPGSSIWEVYAEAIPELQQLADKAFAETTRALNDSAAPTPAWFNPLPLPRTWIDGDTCYDVPPLSGAPVAELTPLAVRAPRASAGTLESERVAATFSANGSIQSLLIDGRKVEVTAHKLVSYHDHPADFEAWDVDRGSIVLGSEARLVSEPEIKVEGLEASVAFSYEIAKSSAVTVIYSVRAGEPALRIRYAVDWHDPKQWLKAIFVSQYNGREARYGAPFGSVLRGQWPGYPREEALWEVPASRWVVVADDAQSEGLGILTESKYGFTTREGTVGISLLRSALVTEAPFHPQIRPTPDRPDYSDLGRQTIDIALTRYAPDLPVHEQPAALADVLFTPCIAYQGGAVTAGFRGCAGLSSAVPAWAEPLDKGWVLRVHETLGRRGTHALTLNEGTTGREADMYGKAVDPLAVEELTFTPYQVRSVLIDQ